MKKEPVLLVLAAGMGSRYGGLKQMDPIDSRGHVILDYSVYDAMKAGFRKVVFIIKREMEEMFREKIGNRIEKQMEVEYVFQELEALPDGFEVPEGRVKPFGTGHAVLCAKKSVDGPFAVINADDFYGRKAFEVIYDYLTTHEDDDKYRYMMVGFHIEKTITENGHVSRGVCQVDQDGYLTEIIERLRIEKKDGSAAYTLDDGLTWIPIADQTPVSMNCWGFSESFMNALAEKFPAFLEKGLEDNPLKCEYFLPAVVADLLEEGRATVQVLESSDQWYGVTYPEDKEAVVCAIEGMSDRYPIYLWE